MNLLLGTFWQISDLDYFTGMLYQMKKYQFCTNFQKNKRGRNPSQLVYEDDITPLSKDMARKKTEKTNQYPSWI